MRDIPAKNVYPYRVWEFESPSYRWASQSLTSEGPSQDVG
jgi:hypothetical protein